MCLRRTTLSVLGAFYVVSGGVAAPQAYSTEFALLIGSQGTGSIPRYDGTTGETVNLFVAPGGGLGSECAAAPMGLLFGPDGNLYIASGGATDTVLRYDGQTGAFIDTFVTDGSGGLNQPASLAFGSDGHLYVSSIATASILRYDGLTGAFIDAFVASGSGGLVEPHGLLFGPDGNLYVCNDIMVEADVLRYDGQTGAFIDVFALGADFGLYENVALEFGPDGNLYVTSAHPGKVVRYDGTSGAPIDVFVSPGSGGLEDPTGLRFGPDGNLYLSEYAGDSVLRYDGQTGAPLRGPLGAAGTAEFIPAGAGGLDCPWDLVFAKLPPPVCLPSSPPQPETLAATSLQSLPETGTGANASGIALNTKNRFVSILAGDAGRGQAIRVRFVDLPVPFDAWNFANTGQDFFVGEPFQACENSGQVRCPNPPTCTGCATAGGMAREWFWAAGLVCDKNSAHYMDWTTIDVVHLFHEGFVPQGVYDIQLVDSSCPLQDEDSYSVPLTMTQARWGDVCGPGPGGACSAVADGSVDVQNDVLGVLGKFANTFPLQKARADIDPGDDGFNNGPDLKVNVANDVLFALDAFTGAPYPFAPGDPCRPD